MVVFDMLNSGVFYELNGVVSSGKEARVYWGTDKEGKDLAVKIYLTSSAEFKKGMLKYIEGDPRFTNIKRDTRSLIAIWAQKEFRNLKEATEAKVPVPKPVAVKSNVVVMEFIGKEGVSAPSLKEAAASQSGANISLTCDLREEALSKSQTGSRGLKRIQYYDVEG